MATKITLHNPDTGLTATASYEFSSITPVTAAFQIVWAFFCNRCYSRGLISKGLKITVAALAVTLPAISAQAQAPRTFVSEAGNDSNPCSFAAPCRHFQAAVNATSAGGEVDALDPAGYGPITITQGITIEGQGWSYIAPPASGNAITINAGGSDKIYIHGVSLNGAGITGGTNGIVFNSGNGLTVTDCVVQNFQYAGPGQTTGDGILVQPSSGAISFVINNTVASNNGFAGIIYLPPNGSMATANGVIDRVVTSNNQFGIAINTQLFGGGSTTVAITNSIASENIDTGISVSSASAALAVSIDNTSSSSNQTGISAGGTPSVILGRSVITGNSGDGIFNGTSSNTFYGYQDNRINGNGTDIVGMLNNSRALK
jgi:hypothetical protein